MNLRYVMGSAALALLAAGCNQTHTTTTTMGKPVLAYATGNYTAGSCTSWEPPEASVWTAPAHGRVEHNLVKAPMKLTGSACDGRVIDYRVSTYVPNPGFRGQDKFTLKYDSITNDAGGRNTKSVDVVVDVK